MSEQLSMDFREHDLPPQWDGTPVTWDAEWSAWEPFICPPPKDPRKCDECDSTRPTLLKIGQVGPRLGIYRTKYNEIRRHQFWDRLTVLRCPDCDADTIICPEGKAWTLGPEDYGPRGSHLQAVDPNQPPQAPPPTAGLHSI